MRIEIKLPPLGDDGPDEGEISFWMVDEGEPVRKGDELAEIITDKATFKVEAPADGRLVEVCVGEGSKAKVGDVLGVMEAAGA